MKIGFDAKRAFNNSTGLGNYSRLVILSLLENFPEHQYYLFTPTIDEKFKNIFMIWPVFMKIRYIKFCRIS